MCNPVKVAEFPDLALSFPNIRCKCAWGGASPLRSGRSRHVALQVAGHLCTGATRLRPAKLDSPSFQSQELLSHSMTIGMLNEPMFLRDQAKPPVRRGHNRCSSRQKTPDHVMKQARARRCSGAAKLYPSTFFTARATALCGCGVRLYVLLVERPDFVQGLGDWDSDAILDMIGLYFLLCLPFPGSYFSFQILTSVSVSARTRTT